MKCTVHVDMIILDDFDIRHRTATVPDAIFLSSPKKIAHVGRR